MPEEIQLATIQLKTNPTNSGFDILPINVGEAKGHGITFSCTVLRESLPLWDGLPCFLDHDYSGSQSVRNLAGALHAPTWNEQEQGIQASLIPGGPGAADLQALRLAAQSDPALMAAVGFSAHLFVLLDDDGVGAHGMHPDGVHPVKRITKVKSVDCVIDPARGGRFLAEQSTIKNLKSKIQKGAALMTDPNPLEPQVPQTPQIPQALQTPQEPDPDLETQSLLTAQAATRAANSRQLTAAESMRQLRITTCRGLLLVSLEASKLPAPSAERVRIAFEHKLDAGTPFEPQELDNAIHDEQNLLSALTASGAIQGPGRITNLVNTADALEAAVSDLFGVGRDARLASVKPAHLTGIRELYFMLTGDYELHGGYFGERIQLATTADFTGLVKNALNKVVSQTWDSLGAAGYNWWEKIARVEHSTTLNTITGVLVGTVGSLPSVAEGAEYTELAVGDSPETADFTKYGGYIPLTLELIDRDDTRRLKAYASELGNAARRKLSSLVAAVFTSNSAIGPTMADTGALFNNVAVTTKGGHANLLTTAIGADYTAWNAIGLAMYNQPMLIKQDTGYYGTGPKLGIWPRYCLVPGALRATAEALFVPRWASQLTSPATTPGAATWGGQVEVVTVPEWTDTTDYAAVIDPNIAPGIIVAERFGLKPEIYTAGRETDAAVFMNDEHRIKVRMFSAVLVQDFRPLHKENVGG